MKRKLLILLGATVSANCSFATVYFQDYGDLEANLRSALTTTDRNISVANSVWDGKLTLNLDSNSEKLPLACIYNNQSEREANSPAGIPGIVATYSADSLTTSMSVSDVDIDNIDNQSIVVQQCDFQNQTDLNQDFNCGGYSKSITTSTTTTTTNSCTLGTGFEYSVEGGFLVKDSFKVSFKAEVNSSNSDSKTDSETITYSVPAQKMTVPPHSGGRIVINYAIVNAHGNLTVSRKFTNPQVNYLDWFVPKPSNLPNCNVLNNTGYGVKLKGTALIPYMIAAGMTSNDNYVLDNKNNALDFPVISKFSTTAGSEMTVVQESYSLDTGSLKNSPIRGINKSPVITGRKVLATVKPVVDSNKTATLNNQNMISNQLGSDSFPSCPSLF